MRIKAVLLMAEESKGRAIWERDRGIDTDVHTCLFLKAQ